MSLGQWVVFILLSFLLSKCHWKAFISIISSKRNPESLILREFFIAKVFHPLLGSVFFSSISFKNFIDCLSSSFCCTKSTGLFPLHVRFDHPLFYLLRFFPLTKLHAMAGRIVSIVLLLQEVQRMQHKSEGEVRLFYRVLNFVFQVFAALLSKLNSSTFCYGKEFSSKTTKSLFR